jgi:hypothetical protein
MLAYRKEDKQMYVRSNGSWSALAEKDKVFIMIAMLEFSSV